MMTLESIEVNGFKSIRELKLDLRPINVLIGANGAGKSNFIQIFKLLKATVQTQLQVYAAQHGADRLLYFGHKTTERIRIQLQLEDYQYRVVLLPTLDDRLEIVDEHFLRNKPFSVGQYTKPRSESEIDNPPLNRSETIKAIFKVISSFGIFHFHDTSATAKLKRTNAINDNEYLREEGENLTAFLYLLRERYNDHYRAIVQIIRQVAPFFDDFTLRPNPLNPETIRLEWRERGSDSYFDASALSDGTLRFMCLVTLLLQPNLPSLILIDEPELGLHPFAITQLAALMKSAARQTQIIVSTQSVPLINQFDPEDVIVVDRKDNQSVFERLKPNDLQTWLEEFTLGELWEKNVIGGQPQAWGQPK